MTLHCSVDSISTKMRRPLFLTLCFILLVDDVLTVTEDKLLEEPEIEEQKGVDERAEGLMARLEALREVEEELAEFREESRGGLGGNLSQLPMLSSEVLNSHQGNSKAKKKGTPNDARELLARLSAIKEQSRRIGSQEESLDSTLIRRAEARKGKESTAKELLARLTQLKESRGGFGQAQETSLGDLNSILSRAGIGKEKKQEGNERLKELSATLDSLLFGRQAQGTKIVNSVKGSGRDRFGSKFKVEPERFKGLRQLSTFEEEPTLGGMELGSLAENVGQGGNVFLFLLSGSGKPQFSIHA